jgi:hypothetical protein
VAPPSPQTEGHRPCLSTRGGGGAPTGLAPFVSNRGCHAQRGKWRTTIGRLTYRRHGTSAARAPWPDQRRRRRAAWRRWSRAWRRRSGGAPWCWGRRTRCRGRRRGQGDDAARRLVLPLLRRCALLGPHVRVLSLWPATARGWSDWCCSSRCPRTWWQRAWCPCRGFAPRRIPRTQGRQRQSPAPGRPRRWTRQRCHQPPHSDVAAANICAIVVHRFRRTSTGSVAGMRRRRLPARQPPHLAPRGHQEWCSTLCEGRLCGCTCVLGGRRPIRCGRGGQPGGQTWRSRHAEGGG